MSTYDFSTLYTLLPQILIIEKLIEQTFNRDGYLYLACNEKRTFSTSEQPQRYVLWSCKKNCDTLHYLFDSIFVKIGSKLYIQLVRFPTGTYYAPLVADLFCVLLPERPFDVFFQTMIKLMLLKL